MTLLLALIIPKRLLLLLLERNLSVLRQDWNLSDSFSFAAGQSGINCHCLLNLHQPCLLLNPNFKNFPFSLCTGVGKDLLLGGSAACEDLSLLLLCLSASQQPMSVFSLIFKTGNSEDLGNHHPISLTNTDYRIMAFVLSSRLQSVIGELVGNDQTAYIKQRYIWL